MKRLLPLMLVLLLLTGCGTDTQESSAPSGTTEPVPTGLYDPDSPIEEQTGGAVRAYPLDGDNYIQVIPMGSKLLLYAADSTLTVLSGDLCESTASVKLDEPSEITAATAQGTAYYNRSTKEVVLLNPQLQEIDRIQMPEDIQQSPCISLENNTVYYCVPGEVRAIDIETGISRLVRSHSYAEQWINDCYFDGTVLYCTFGDGESTSVYLSADTGQTLWQDEHLYPFYTYGENYYLHRMDGSVSQMIVGQRNGQAQLLNIEAGWVYDAMSLGGILTYSERFRDIDYALEMALYNVESGKCTAFVSIEGVEDPKSFASTDKYLWVLASDNRYYDHQVLYRWDVSQTPINEDIVYTQTLYTASNPDTERLAQCQERVDALNKKYGVRISIWEDAVSQPGEHTLVPEYQPETISKMLDELEPVLALFPEKFLQKTVEAGWIRICLVRNIDDGSEASVQYWEDGDCYIALTYKNQVEADFLLGVANAIDSHVLGNSRDFDTWDALNPEGFAYTYDYELSQQQEYVQTYLTIEDSAFVNIGSMNSPVEDRCHIFYCAITANGEDEFDTALKQAKLKRLCEGIREAYGLEKSTEVYPWEQYLTQPLDYTN